MAFRGFLIESYHYIYPRTFIEWVKFIFGIPKAWIRFHGFEKQTNKK